MRMQVFKRYSQTASPTIMSNIRRHQKWWTALFILSIFTISGCYLLLLPPDGPPSKSTVVITYGASASLVTQTLANAHVIAHPELLQLILRFLGARNQAKAGVYSFITPESLLTVAYRLITGAYGIPLIRMTFPEGMSVREMAAEVASTYPSISAEEFISAGQSYEGYLFPDTYFFSPSADAASIVSAMRTNFNAKIAPLSNEIDSSEYSLRDIIILSSLVEKEARTNTDMRIVAGILFNRLKIGMPLQVDAVFGYIYNRATYSPSLADLKVNSPYNTYTHTGLPPGPIDNPGLNSIEAVLNPIKTKYLYYLTGKDGLMHYATTYAGHQSNLRKYLD